ncbi:MAG: acyloxyacyl hydrolase [Syntrophothermus sp.]
MLTIIRKKVFRRAVFCLLPLIVLLPRESRGQFEHKLFTSNMMAEMKFQYGFVYPHNIVLELFQSHLTAFEFNIHQETYGKHVWERVYSYPEIGVSLWYSNLGKSEWLGDAYSIFPYLNFPLFRSKTFSFNFRLGLGVGYITKPFNRLDNYKNLAIGSHFNASADLMLEARYKINYRLTASAGISLHHFSNGSLKLPNYGINLPLANIGMAYRLARENPLIGDRFLAPTQPYEAIIRHLIQFDVGALVGYKNMQSVYGENFLVYHFFENTWFPVSRKSKWGAGLDLSYDKSHIVKLEKQGDTLTNNLKILRPGVNAAYSLGLSKVAFIFNLGYYLGGAEHSNGPLYEKLSFQYNFTKYAFMTVMLKVHWGRADYIGWGLGIRMEQLYGKKTIK